MAKKESKKKDDGYIPKNPHLIEKVKEEKSETETDDTTFKYEYNDPFVPDDKKIERVKKQVRADRIVKDRIALDFWLRHELQLGTGQIKKLWIKMDNVYKV